MHTLEFQTFELSWSLILSYINHCFQVAGVNSAGEYAKKQNKKNQSFDWVFNLTVLTKSYQKHKSTGKL